MIFSKLKIAIVLGSIAAAGAVMYLANMKFDQQMEKLDALTTANAQLASALELTNATNKRILDHLSTMQTSMDKFNEKVVDNEVSSKTLVNKITREVIIEKTQGDNKAASKLVTDEFNSYLGSIGK